LTLLRAGWEVYEIPSIQSIAAYLDPLTFGGLDVGEQFQANGKVYEKIGERHAAFVGSIHGFDEDEEVERVD